MKNTIAYLALAALLAVAVLAFRPADAPAEDSMWVTDYAEAVKQAKKEDKKLLLNFTGSDWCGWCIRLDKEVFSQAEFKEYAEENLVLVKLDFPKRKELPEDEKAQNNELAQKYGIRGFPTIILLDSEEKLVGQTGYQRGGAAAYVKHVEAMINKQ